MREIISTILETFLIEPIYKKSRWSHPKYNKLKKSCVNFVIITSPALFIYPCYSSMFTVFANLFFASMIKNKLLQVPRISLPLIKNDKTSQEVDQKWTYLLMLNPCVYVCVCQVGLWFLSTRMSQHANSFVNFTLFCVESFGTIIQKL